MTGRRVVSVVGRLEDGAFVTLGPKDPEPTLDIDLLIRVLWNAVIPARHWLDSETTTENFARWLAAEYDRLAKR